MTLQYTIDKLLETHAITIERDMASADEFGAEPKKNWQFHAILKGRFGWWAMHGSRGGFKEEVDPQRTVKTAGGLILLHSGVDVTDRDRVANILHPIARIETTGPFRIISLREYETHMELTVARP